MKKNVLILSCNGLTKAPRVIKEIRALKGLYNVTFAGKIDSESYEGCNLVKLSFSRQTYPPKAIKFHLKYPFFLKKIISFLIKIYLGIIFYKIRTYESFSLEDYKLLMKSNYDVIIIHYPELLKLGFKLKRYNTKIIFSAHEYYPEEFNDEKFMKFTKPYYDYLCKKYLPKVDLILSPSQSIAELYAREFNPKSLVMLNTHPFKELTPSVPKGDKIRIIHHGICIPQRDTEFLLNVASILGDKYEVNLMLIPNNSEYYNYIVSKAKLLSNVKILPPQTYDQLVNFINMFDIFLIHFLPEVTNYNFSLPNKLFDAIQGRLCLVSTPLKDISDFIRKHNIGKVSDDFTPQSVARTIRGLSSEEINLYKQNSDRWSKVYCSENTEKFILECMNSVLSGNKLPVGLDYLQK